jgi:hypothetical protein
MNRIVSTSGCVERAPESSRRSAERKAALLEYFVNPPPEMREMDAAWEEALLLYGDEDSDAWVSALEDGTHPLWRLGAPGDMLHRTVRCPRLGSTPP